MRLAQVDVRQRYEGAATIRSSYQDVDVIPRVAPARVTRAVGSGAEMNAGDRVGLRAAIYVIVPEIRGCRHGQKSRPRRSTSAVNSSILASCDVSFIHSVSSSWSVQVASASGVSGVESSGIGGR